MPSAVHPPTPVQSTIAWPYTTVHCLASQAADFAIEIIEIGRQIPI